MKKIFILLILTFSLTINNVYSNDSATLDDLTKLSNSISKNNNIFLKNSLDAEKRHILIDSYIERGRYYKTQKEYLSAANDYRSALFYLTFYPGIDEYDVYLKEIDTEVELKECLKSLKPSKSITKRYEYALYLLQHNNLAAAGYEFYNIGFNRKYAQIAQNQFYNVARTIYGSYFVEYEKFYIVDEDNMTIRFLPYTEFAYKLLNKEDQKTYKACLQIDKKDKANLLYAKRNNKPLYTNSKFLPILINEYQHNMNLNTDLSLNYALKDLIAINESNKVRTLFSQDMINSKLAYLYYINKQYSNAIAYYEPFLNEVNNDIKTKKDYGWDWCVISNLADCYYYLKNYKKAIYYANMIPKGKTNYLYTQEILYFSYLKLNNKATAHQYAMNLYYNSYPNVLTAISRIVYTTSDINKQLKYLEIAIKKCTSASEKYRVVLDLIPVDKKRIDNASKTIKGYFIKPIWSTIVEQDRNLMTMDEESNRYFDYHADINNCIKNYSGNNLKACFDGINKKQEKYTQRLIAEKNERQRLNELRMINDSLYYSNILQSERNSLQMQQNDLLREQNYQLSKPSYTYSTITRTGNFYNINSVSY